MPCTPRCEKQLKKTLQALPTSVRRMPMRRILLTAAICALLLGGTAMAAQMSGIVDFWRYYGRETEGASFIEQPVSQQGGALEDATFTVREAVFDGQSVQIVIEARPAEGIVLWPEDPDVQTVQEHAPREGEQVRIAVAGVAQIDGATPTGGDIAWVWEDGVLVYYESVLLDTPVDTRRAQVEVTVLTYPPENIEKMQRGSVRFEVKRAKTQIFQSAVAFEWNEIVVVKVRAESTSLGTTVTLTYMPNTTGNIRPDFFVCQKDGSDDYWQESAREEVTLPDGKTGIQETMRFACVETLPDMLTMGMQGTDVLARWNFKDGTARTINEGGKEQ